MIDRPDHLLSLSNQSVIEIENNPSKYFISSIQGSGSGSFDSGFYSFERHLQKSDYFRAMNFLQDTLMLVTFIILFGSRQKMKKALSNERR